MWYQDLRDGIPTSKTLETFQCEPISHVALEEWELNGNILISFCFLLETTKNLQLIQGFWIMRCDFFRVFFLAKISVW